MSTRAPWDITVDFWEYIPHGHCGLCGNSGVIDTTGVRTAAGKLVGGKFWCICPNGRSLKGLNKVDPATPENLNEVTPERPRGDQQSEETPPAATVAAYPPTLRVEAGDRFVYAFGSATDHPELRDWEVRADVVDGEWVVYRWKPQGVGHHWSDPVLGHVTLFRLLLRNGELQRQGRSK